MDELYAWLTSLPPLALYLTLAAAAALENVFPPLPSDSVVAFGSFLAARGNATPTGTFLATWVGSVGGAMLVYATARRFGADWLHARLRRFGGEQREHTLERMYRQYGSLALFLSRFLPGVRAVVPPFAGALQVPPVRAAAAIGLASGIWYGIITIVAYRVGADWDALRSRVGSLSRTAAILAAAVAAVLVAFWLIRRRIRGRQS